MNWSADNFNLNAFLWVGHFCWTDSGLFSICSQQGEWGAGGDSLYLLDLDWIVGPGYSLGGGTNQKPWKTMKPPWKIMETNQKPWKTIKPPWKSMKTNQKPWKTMKPPWKTMGTNQKPWKTMKPPWKTLCHKYRVPTDLHWCKNVTVTNRGVQLTFFGAKNVTVTNRGVQLTSFDAKNVTVTNRGIQLTSFDAKNVTVTNRGIQLTYFDAKNVTVTNRGVQLTSFDAKNVTVTNRGSNWPFRCLDFHHLRFLFWIGLTRCLFSYITFHTGYSIFSTIPYI